VGSVFLYFLASEPSGSLTFLVWVAGPLAARQPTQKTDELLAANWLAKEQEAFPRAEKSGMIHIKEIAQSQIFF